MTTTTTSVRETRARAVIAGWKEEGAWTLAGRVNDVSLVASRGVAGQFLRDVRDAVAEAAEYMVDHDEIPDGWDASWDSEDADVADSAVPVYTADIWRVFVDLSAWRVDITDLVAGDEDMTRRAEIAVYEVARQLAWSLLDDLSEAVAVVE